MTIATSQPSALNPLGDEQLVGASVTGTFPNQGDLQGVFVGGTRVGETLEGVTITGTNAPIDAQRLEGVILSGTRRKKSEPMHLYYPQALADPTSEFKNAIQFTVYQQENSFETLSNEVPVVKQVPEIFRQSPRFPISPGGAAAAYALLNNSVNTVFPLLGGVSQVAQDLIGIGYGGFQYFTNGQNTNYGKRTRKIDQTITLYMPDTIVNQDKHDYQPVSLTQATGRAGLLSQSSPLGGSQIGQVEVAAELAGQAGILGTRATEAVLAGFGYALNPMLEMIYGGTNPREFQFQFRFAPRNKREADEVIKIIRALRFHSSTESAGSGVDSGSTTGLRYVVPPNHVEVQFLRRVNGRFEENLSLPRIATCMITGINTNYAAQLDTFTTTPDGIPTSISLDLALVESVVLTKSDIGNGY